MRWFWESEELMESGCTRLKVEVCPHCGRQGTLNRHGWLLGSEAMGSGKQARRGRRLYCSNRGRREGCGRTVSVRPGELLKGMRTRSGPLWRYVRGVMEGRRPADAWEGLGRFFSLESAYRYRRRFLKCQHRIKEVLYRERAPPQGAVGTLGALLGHLESVLGGSEDLVRDFQIRFQETWPG